MTEPAEQTAIESVVMRRVYRARVLRLIISGAAFALSLILLALYGLGREVWVAMVFRNGPQSFGGHALYLLYALEHTRFVVQLLVLICLGSFLYLAQAAARALASAFAAPMRA